MIQPFLIWFCFACLYICVTSFYRRSHILCNLYISEGGYKQRRPLWLSSGIESQKRFGPAAVLVPPISAVAPLAVDCVSFHSIYTSVDLGWGLHFIIIFLHLLAFVYSLTTCICVSDTCNALQCGSSARVFMCRVGGFIVEAAASIQRYQCRACSWY